MYKHPAKPIVAFAFLAFTCLTACDRSSTESQNTHGKTSGEAPVNKTAWVTGDRIANADSEIQNWLSHGRGYFEQRFSPLDQISETTIDRLQLAWFLDLDTRRGQQATPLIVDGIMYSSSAWSKVQAIDAATGELLWQFDPEVPREWNVRTCCGVQNRGVAAWKGNIFVGTLDGRLIAIDAETGQLQWSVQTTDVRYDYSITGAPRVVKGNVIIGNGGAEFGVRGYVTAYEAETGQQAWRFYTVPGNPALGFESKAMEMAAGTWSGEWWKLGGGGTAWDSFAFDPDLDLLYIGVGNGAPWPREMRSPGGGDNLFLASIVAVRPDTGEYVWHYQTVPGDTWDYTAVQQMILADLEIGGRLRKVIMQAPKNGFFYVLDRETGEFLSAEGYMPTNWATHIDPETGRPVETDFSRYDETGEPVHIVPGPGGAHNWQPMSFNPETGLVYIPAKQESMLYYLDDAFKVRALGMNAGVNMWELDWADYPLDEQYMPENQGHLLAWDPVRQKEIWRAPQPGSHNGGVLSTAGNLIFQGTADSEFIAYRATDGERLWTSDVQSGVVAPPVTYAIDGEQYIALVAGWGTSSALWEGPALNPDGDKQNISRVLAYKLDGQAQLPPPPPLPARVAPPAPFGDEATLETGRAEFAKNCDACHGVMAIGGGELPDLRWSPYISSAESFQSVVIDGALKEKGMVSFAPNITPSDAEAIRAWVVAQAHIAME
jgi:alcohol dehydrogenase (cytochrome c)/quinohemoprotein ethanol dehydrogenase